METDLDAVRICELYNRHRGKNPLVDLLNADLRDVLGDLHFVDNKTLDRCYVSNRFESSPQVARMSGHDPGQYRPNSISQWSEDKAAWAWDRSVQAAKERLDAYLPDPAEAYAASFLFTSLEKLLITADPRGLPGAVPVKQRILFIQAGRGTGKSTMLEHLCRIGLPSLDKKHALPASILPISVDLNEFSSAEPISSNWKELLRTFRSQLHSTFALDSTDGWKTISEPDLKTETGEDAPEVAWSPSPASRRVKTIIYACKNPDIFFSRAARYLRLRKPPVFLLFILDNIDREPIRQRQIQYIDRFFSLMRRVSNAMGIVSIRRSSLSALRQGNRLQDHLRPRCLFMTAPRIGDIVQKRIDLLLEEIEKIQEPVSIKIARNLTVTLGEALDLFRHVFSAFEATVSNLDGPAARLAIPDTAIERFLPYAFHTDTRAALEFVVRAMESWALRYQPVVRDFLVRRDHGESKWLTPFTFDELLRVGAVGEYELFDHTENPDLFNVYCFRRVAPAARDGRFPLLLFYRSLQICAQRRKCRKKEFFELLLCFNYSREECRRVLTILLEHLFVESPEGTDLRMIRNLLRTKKLEYYYRFLCVSLTYIETMIPDMVLEYRARPRQVDARLHDDLFEVSEFCRYVLQQEKCELAYARDRGPGHVKTYKRIAFDLPLAMRIYESVNRRATDIFLRKRWMFTEKEVKRLKDDYDALRDEIQATSWREEIWPMIPRRRLLPFFEAR